MIKVSLELWGYIEPNAEILNRKAANISAFFLPYLSVTKPEITQPNIVPSRAEETTHPNMAGVTENGLPKRYYNLI